MPVYLVTDVTVHDPVRYREYSRQGFQSVTKHGGRFLVEGGAPERIEGTWAPRRMAIVEFPSREAALAFYHSHEYQAAKQARLGLADFNMVLVEPPAHA